MHRYFVLWAILAAMNVPASAQQHRFVETLERLAVKVPEGALASNGVYSTLDQLTREPCDQQAIVGLGAALEKLGYRREAANAHVGFSKACGGHPASLRRAVNILLGLSDYAGAIRVATKLIELEPLIDNGYYLRAVAQERGGDARKAIDDYITATQLFPDKDQIANASYFAMARLHDKLGQPCDAVNAIASWVALHPRNDSSQTRTAIQNYSSKGNCKVVNNDAEELIAISRPGNVVRVSVAINGVRGVFLSRYRR